MPSDVVPQEVLGQFKDVFDDPSLECVAFVMRDGIAEFSVREKPDEYKIMSREVDKDRISVSLEGLLRIKTESEPLKKDLDLVVCYRHSGSTLLMNALAELPGVFIINESVFFPQRIKRLERFHGNDSNWKDILDLSISLCARTYRKEDVAVFKIFADAGDVFVGLLERKFPVRGIYMLTDFRNFYAKVMCSEKRVKDTVSFVAEMKKWTKEPEWLARELQEPLTGPQSAAMYWYATQWHYANKASRFDNVRHLHLEEFLAAPAEVLKRIGQFLKKDWSAEAINAVVTGPVLRRHAHEKGKEFSAADRDQEIEETLAAMKSEFAAAQEYLQRLLKIEALPAEMPRRLIDD